MRSKPIPIKLKYDAIVEALLEIRFEMTTIPEIFFGRLAEYQPWKGFSQHRMPGYEIPAPLRQVNSNLRFQPIFELSDASKHRAVHIGQQVLSYHRRIPYIGWEKFRPELEEAYGGLFEKADGLKIQRLGLRYLNALRADLHGIQSMVDLDLKVEIAGESVHGDTNINFTTDVTDNASCTVRIATPGFVQGVLPPNASVYIDVDVFTKEDFRTDRQNDVKTWVETAHAKEKEQFFRLLKEQTIESLKEK